MSARTPEEFASGVRQLRTRLDAEGLLTGPTFDVWAHSWALAYNLPPSLLDWPPSAWPPFRRACAVLVRDQRSKIPPPPTAALPCLPPTGESE